MLCEDRAMERRRAYEAIAEALNETGFDTLGWTPDVVAETEQRMAIDDADVWDSSAHFVEFTLRVLDKLDIIEPYEGPGDYHPRESGADSCRS
jgi:hypothetical protein